MKNLLLLLMFAMSGLLVSVSITGCSNNKTNTGAAVHNAVWSDGTWIRDTQGRVIMVHGINVGQGWPPYLPMTATTVSQTAYYFFNIKQAGFNAVRLIVIWAGIEPTPGTIDTNYLDQLQQEVKLCADNGLLVLLDMHQDLYSQSFCYGDGAPAWACDLTGYDPSQCNTGIWSLNYTLPPVAQSFQNFWDDKPGPDTIGLQEHYTNIFVRLAQRFTSASNILGYEIMNEPFSGQYSLFTTDFEIHALVPFYEKVAKGIRQVDPFHIIAYEPSNFTMAVFHNTSISETTFTKKSSNLLFAPHYYPLSSLTAISDADISSMADNIAAIANVSTIMKTPYIVGEMGLDHNETGSAKYMTALLGEFDKEISNWMFWEYRAAFSGNSGLILLDSTGANAFPIMDILSRPYPVLTAGTPVSISYPITSDPATFSTTTFTYLYKEDGIGRGTTEIFLPKMHFPNGFTVTTSDGSVSFDTSTDILSYTRGSRSTHTITVAPCNPTNSGCVSF